MPNEGGGQDSFRGGGEEWWDFRCFVFFVTELCFFLVWWFSAEIYIKESNWVCFSEQGWEHQKRKDTGSI